ENTWFLANERLLKRKDAGNTAYIGSTGYGKTSLLKAHVESQIGYGAIPADFDLVNAFIDDVKNDLLPWFTQIGCPLPIISANRLDPSIGARWAIGKEFRGNPLAAKRWAYDVIPKKKGDYWEAAPRQLLAGVAMECVHKDRPWDERIALQFVLNP